VSAGELFANPWVWVSVAAIMVTQLSVAVAYNLGRAPLGDAVRVGALDGVAWSAQMAAMAVAAWFLPLEGGRWRRSIPAILGVAGAVATVRVAVVHGMFGLPPGLAAIELLPQYVVGLLSGAGAGYAIFYYFRRRDREEVAARLDAALARANVQLLEMRTDPHFLFNTLNSVAALLERHPGDAVELLGALKRLVARAETTAARATVPLDEEMELVRAYLQIEQRRLGARLSVAWRVDPAAGAAPIPRLVLQTLVENAVRHGIAPLRRGGTVEIGARTRGGRLQAWVRDDGAGLRAAAGGREGIGLAGTAARLRHLYGADHRFEVSARAEGGVEARIDIPLETADGDPVG
jgi:signal transduction histidine kinase